MAIAISLETLVMEHWSNLMKHSLCRLKPASLRVLRVCSFQAVLVLLVACFAASANAQTHAVVVSGLGGESQYTEQFSKTGRSVYDALQTLDVDDNLVVYLDETATREDILQAIKNVASRIQADVPAVFALFFIGHGNADSEGWRFNVKGPDFTTEDLVAAVNPIASSQQLIVLATSASGAALEILSQPQRVVVTATKNGGENNAVKFPQFLTQALQQPDADYDRNEILTIAEVFRFAHSRTEEYYEEQKLLAPEHARLSGDNAVDISVALLGSLKNANNDPAVAPLLEERLVLEDAFKDLKRAKATLASIDYYAQLEQLLLKIARLQQSIDAATGWSESDAES